ncbi:hypothetical protein PHYSODRAFT_354601 [Phytophthora sojae]|uniref:Uncharacterized protein n=1 Tax=Phytophthora sojae (strain P6497) TaxID=1094619 RepID=G4ZI08_PHYSP|nr:hypothetical protein PHYSODRAFT_354601 [Phytophthora sojae]EGZ17651.1 hypothetical protein PHYSODRAFT_354601 [Phytophthora sojae]|eukprot:XP_009526709.1 hypothetical protein PHYSODRAFT_354601 [Phytophthora sojae]
MKKMLRTCTTSRWLEWRRRPRRAPRQRETVALAAACQLLTRRSGRTARSAACCSARGATWPPTSATATARCCIACPSPGRFASTAARVASTAAARAVTKTLSRAAIEQKGGGRVKKRTDI